TCANVGSRFTCFPASRRGAAGGLAARRCLVETSMRIEECPRCSTVTFAGRIDGLPYRLDTITVPPEHAAILDIYGRELAAVEIRTDTLAAVCTTRPSAESARLHPGRAPLRRSTPRSAVALVNTTREENETCSIYS